MATLEGFTQSDDLRNAFTALRSKNPTTRQHGATELHRFVSTTVAEMSSEAAAKLWDNTINREIFDLIHSSNSHEKQGGLLAIENLIDQGGMPFERNRNLFRFGQYVKSLLPSNDINIMLMASKTFGRIAKITEPAFGEGFMVSEVTAAVQLLQADKQEFRYAGVLILKELARNVASSFYLHIDLVFDSITAPLRDSRIMVREGASELLAACLEILANREKQPRSTYVAKMAQDAAIGLKAPAPETIHGALLIYRELFLHGGLTMRETFVEVGHHVMGLRLHKDPLVRRTVVILIPTLASFDKSLFVECFLHTAAPHLISILEKPQDRSSAFVSLGHTAVAVGVDMKGYLEPVMAQIKLGFQQRGKKNAPPEEPMFQCLGMLAEAVGPSLTKLLHDQLDLMFAGGLTESLRQALSSIEMNIKPLRRTVQERLLDMLSQVLSGQPYRPLGAPPPLRSEASSGPKDMVTVQTSGSGKSPELITLALETLGSFNFTEHHLSEMARSCVLPYLEDDYPEVRRAAAITCCALFIDDPITFHVSNHALEVIGDVVDKLLVVGIADPDPDIRQTVLSSLHERFDKHLAQAENVRSLFIALNDEVFENRVMAVSLIGRLAAYNPAYVMPSLRKALIQLLTELEYSTVQRHREECTHLLRHLVSATQKLIKPYALPILRVLLPKADDPNTTVAANIILSLGELASAGGEDALELVPALMGVIIPRLSDTSLPKRDAALSTLGLVCASTTYVIDPLIDHPELIPLLRKIVKTEQRLGVRSEVIKVLGIIGALNPYGRHRRPIEESRVSPKTMAGPFSAPQTGAASTADDFYQKVAINALLTVLKDPSLSMHYHVVIEAIMSMFKTQGLKCVSFLPQIIPVFASVTRRSPARYQDFHLQQLTILVGIIRQHVRNFMPDVVGLITDLWSNVNLHLPLVSLVDALGRALEAEFKPFLPEVLPLLLKLFDGETVDSKSEKKVQAQIKVFDAFYTFGTSIEEYLHLIIPIIVRTYERGDAPPALRKRGIQSIDGLSRKVNFSDHASRIIHPLVRVLRNSTNELRLAALDCLCSLVIQLGSDFAIFVPTIQKTLHSIRLSHARYESFITKLLNGERLPREHGPLDVFATETTRTDVPVEPGKFTVNQQHVKQAWDISQLASKPDWLNWYHSLSAVLIRESPSPALRACMNVVSIHSPLLTELFNAAFISCWGELYDQYQEDLVRCLEIAMTQADAPPEVTQALLNLAEFMEHEDKPLPLENRTLGEYATKNNAFAKALHYKELEFFTDPSPSVIEALLEINTKLQQNDAALGTLTMATDQFGTTKHEEWYIKLNRWQGALEAYDERLSKEPGNVEVVVGKMRCLHALGEWEKLSAYVEQYWDDARMDRKRIAPMAAAAAWSMNEWAGLSQYLTEWTEDSADRQFHEAIYLIHDNNFLKAAACIDRAREHLDVEFTRAIENYGRSYNVMVRAQMLSELEEIIRYRQSADQPERQATMRRTWMKRTLGCQADVDVWQRILQVRNLVLKPEDDPGMWIKFANLCRKANRMPWAEKAIESLLPSAQAHARAAPNVVYAQLKLMWAQGDQTDSISHLRRFAESLTRDLQGRPERHASGSLSQTKLDELSQLLARCHLKLGEWQKELIEDWGSDVNNEILECYLLATRYDGQWYKAWHTWALANFEVVNYLESHSEPRLGDVPSETLVPHTVQAVQGFFRSIQLRSENALQDTLRLLTLWFKYGAHDEVSHAMANGFAVVEVDTWLEVIPQIIARIQTPSANIRRTISSLLMEIGKMHPQAMIYPLTVASKSSSVARKSAALAIMEGMRQHSFDIVEQALLVSHELIRVAILWHELWHEGLEEASRFYFTEKNPDGMIAVLEPLHDMLEAGATTQRETSFAQVFGRDLHEARDACRRFRVYGEVHELDRAWDIYYGVFKKIEKQLPQLTNLDLQFVSPELLRARDLQLAVPGTYRSGEPVVKIASFATKLSVIASKQRPRRLSLKGSDGQDYEYVLKGHEDLRQDERVMQLFSLVNNLLIVDSESFRRNLNIRRYPIIPLAPNAGLGGWVQESDTLHVLVRDYREARKVLLNIEYRLMLQMAPDYEQLTLLQKVEVFEYALENTTGQDLYRVLWVKSANSEHWLERRATYTRSLAVSSMVGHILGLGDRHPSNLLLERGSGKVVHIDFGDCFEVAMHREKFPEKIPFRLTRMLTNAMEVSGILGSFKITCEISMGVLRANKDSLLAVLEAFVYDPLINWRLMQHDVRPEGTDTDAHRSVELAKVAAHPQGITKKLKADENEIFNDGLGDPAMRHEVRNDRALAVYNRVQQKLTGRDFNPDVVLDVSHQVEKLIQQAISLENLCQCFSGWCAFW